MKSLNHVALIGNLTKDVELRKTTNGSDVCSFTIATNREWTEKSGAKKQEAEFHHVLAWERLAQLCGQLLKKGSLCYVEGRLQTKQWKDSQGQNRSMTEIVAADMIVLNKVDKLDQAML